MKKIFYILLPIAVFIFCTASIYVHSGKEKFGTCAAPYNLDAVKSGTSIVLSWVSGPIQHSYGGYYNYGTGQTQFFNGYTNTYPISITVPSSTYSITYQVTAICTDGTTSTSAPFSKNF